MDISPSGLLTNWVPNLPQIAKTTLLSLLGRHPNSEYQDVVTEIIAQALRPILSTPSPLLKSQKMFGYDPGVWGRMWVSKWTVPVDETVKNVVYEGVEDGEAVLTAQDAMRFAIETLATRDEELHFDMPDLQDVDCEWSSYRKNVGHLARLPNASQAELYNMMMDDIGQDVPTILYIHGGAFCLMDISNHRWQSTLLAQNSKGRAFAVRHRLSPQAKFPAALLDVFMAYLALLSPPLGAFHEAVPASKIVIAGESSGGGLAVAFQVFLIALVQHKKNKILFHGKVVTIPDPPSAALSVTSPWLDISRSLPSTSRNYRWDIIAPPSLDVATPPFPADEIWPTSPPRAETYCSASDIAHPLCSPLTTPKSLLADMPPIWVLTGWESMQDECEVFYRRVAEAKRKHGKSDACYVDFEGWIGMFHTFSFFPFNYAGWQAVAHRGRHIRDAVEGKMTSKEVGLWYSSKHKGQVTRIPLEKLGLTNVVSGYDRSEPLTDEVVERYLERARVFRVELEERMVGEWRAKLNANP